MYIDAGCFLSLTTARRAMSLSSSIKVDTTHKSTRRCQLLTVHSTHADVSFLCFTSVQSNEPLLSANCVHPCKHTYTQVHMNRSPSRGVFIETNVNTNGTINTHPHFAGVVFFLLLSKYHLNVGRPSIRRGTLRRKRNCLDFFVELRF